MTNLSTRFCALRRKLDRVDALPPDYFVLVTNHNGRDFVMTKQAYKKYIHKLEDVDLQSHMIIGLSTGSLAYMGTKVEEILFEDDIKHLFQAQ